MVASIGPAFCFIAAFLLVFHLWLLVPSCLEPVVWTSPNLLPQFQEASAVNNLLQRSQKLQGVIGPECIAFDLTGVTAYISNGDGTVSAFNASTLLFVKTVFFTGKHILRASSHRTVNGMNHEDFQKWCEEEAFAERLQWNTANERLCGRPLGLRYAIVSVSPKVVFQYNLL
jgi:hypothetical protein